MGSKSKLGQRRLMLSESPQKNWMKKEDATIRKVASSQKLGCSETMLTRWRNAERLVE